ARRVCRQRRACRRRPAGRRPTGRRVLRSTIDDMSKPEVWLRGVVDGVPPHLQPVAHSLMQCREELAGLLTGMPPERIWRTCPNAASIGFHVRHAMGSLDRLFTYARGDMLSDAQRATLAQELQPDAGLTADDLLAAVDAAVERALDQL